MKGLRKPALAFLSSWIAVVLLGYSIQPLSVFSAPDGDCVECLYCGQFTQVNTIPPNSSTVSSIGYTTDPEGFAWVPFAFNGYVNGVSHLYAPQAGCLFGKATAGTNTIYSWQFDSITPQCIVALEDPYVLAAQDGFNPQKPTKILQTECQ